MLPATYGSLRALPAQTFAASPQIHHRRPSHEHYIPLNLEPSSPNCLVRQRPGSAKETTTSPSQRHEDLNVYRMQELQKPTTENKTVLVETPKLRPTFDTGLNQYELTRPLPGSTTTAPATSTACRRIWSFLPSRPPATALRLRKGNHYVSFPAACGPKRVLNEETSEIQNCKQNNVN